MRLNNKMQITKSKGNSKYSKRSAWTAFVSILVLSAGSVSLGSLGSSVSAIKPGSKQCKINRMGLINYGAGTEYNNSTNQVTPGVRPTSTPQVFTKNYPAADGKNESYVSFNDTLSAGHVREPLFRYSNTTYSITGDTTGGSSSNLSRTATLIMKQDDWGSSPEVNSAATLKREFDVPVRGLSFWVSDIDIRDGLLDVPNTNPGETTRDLDGRGYPEIVKIDIYEAGSSTPIDLFSGNASEYVNNTEKGAPRDAGIHLIPSPGGTPSPLGTSTNQWIADDDISDALDPSKDLVNGDQPMHVTQSLFFQLPETVAVDRVEVSFALKNSDNHVSTEGGTSLPWGIGVSEPEFAGPCVGLAKSAQEVNGSEITYRLTAKNVGGFDLNKMELLEDLDEVFNKGNYSITSAPQVSGGDAAGIVINPAFNGSTDKNILNPSSVFNFGETTTIDLKVNVNDINIGGNGTGTYDNVADMLGAVKGSVDPEKVTDDSVDGLEVDPDGDGDPSNNQSVTRVVLGVDPPVSTIKAPKTGAIVGAIIVSVATLSLAAYLMKEAYDKREKRLKSEK